MLTAPDAKKLHWTCSEKQRRSNFGDGYPDLVLADDEIDFFRQR